jgi:gamma-glutamyl hercynylcysteine S-oxide synthase
MGRDRAGATGGMGERDVDVNDHEMTTARVRAALERSRERTLDLLAPLSIADLTTQHSELMSPLVWDFAHVAHYEELWLLRELLGDAPTEPRFDDVYDAFKHPRRDRPALDLLGVDDAQVFAAGVRKRVLDGLVGGPIRDRSGADDRLRRDGFVYGMVVQHEHQHIETMLATLQLREATYPLPLTPATAGDPDSEGDISVAGGAFTMGTDVEPWAYDNERPAHEATVGSFRIDRTPVTNRAYFEFVAAGGYRDDTAWSDAGRSWRDEAALEHPEFWRAGPDGSWGRRRFGHWEPVPPDEPVQHVCWYEADAFARWAGKRLPTETEWEYASSWDPTRGTKSRYPWGDTLDDANRANLGGARFAPDPVGSHPTGVSALGCHQMVGDVWEWTASEFSGYPRFAPYPYREYSEVFFDDGYRVLRGGSWATDASAMRTTFRNWDFPIRRQIFAGFRCAS